MIGERLRDLRDEHELTQVKVAKLLGVSQAAYQRYESGDRAVPDEVKIFLAQYYNVTIDYLLGKTNDRASAIISDLDNKKVKYADLTAAQKKMINRMDELSDEEQENLYDIADNFLKLSEKRIKK